MLLPARSIRVFYVKAAVGHLPTAIDVLSQMLTKPLLEKEAIEREKGVVVEEINMYEDLPPRKVSNLFDEIIFGKNSLGRETIGNKKSVRAFSSKDLFRYLRKRYTTGRVVVGLVGGIGNGKKDIDSIRKMVEKGFLQLGKGKHGWGEKMVKVQKKPDCLVYKKRYWTSAFCFGGAGFCKRAQEAVCFGSFVNNFGREYELEVVYRN